MDAKTRIAIEDFRSVMISEDNHHAAAHCRDALEFDDEISIDTVMRMVATREAYSDCPIDL